MRDVFHPSPWDPIDESMSEIKRHLDSLEFEIGKLKSDMESRKKLYYEEMQDRIRQIEFLLKENSELKSIGGVK